MNIAEQNIRLIRLRAQLAAKRQQLKLARLTAQADALEKELAEMNTESLDVHSGDVEVAVPQAADYDVHRGRRVKVSANGNGQY